MKKETKENIQYGSAVGMLVSGVAFAVAGFIAPPMGEIHDSVLLIFAQCLIYAGSVFGIAVFATSKVDYLNSKIEALRTELGKAGKEVQP